MCRRRQGYIGPVNSKTYASAKGVASKGGKGATKDLKPPDLWIHHDQMELKAMDKSSNPEAAMTATPISRNSQEISEEHIGTFDKKNSGGGYMAMGPAAVSNGSMNAGLEGSSINMGRPIYPRTQYNIPRAHVTIDAMHSAYSNALMGTGGGPLLSLSSAPPLGPPPSGPPPQPPRRQEH
ncbi:hypothetical protein HPB52_024402 [Rhipicephalus sanguineus]|uniref:Neogenin C-terminal domain-containing protein n=1 Tax=Rhipicephalus sanguineus TaxID=34632 RepID=A0A9D4YR99_RHISA|nr:hypothetical protein HPB52_024402 [Rhipicephalus sanguineus]